MKTNPRTRKPTSTYSRSNSSTSKMAMRTLITKMTMARCKSKSMMRSMVTLIKTKALMKMTKKALNLTLMGLTNRNVNFSSHTSKKSMRRTLTLSRSLRRSSRS